ncbi:MAG TPA: nucleotidyltransferase family protein [Steroidobacteraceae bacterium]|nr:nucleotidyltransferase family protein [Steroidobacteraceae bacterium]
MRAMILAAGRGERMRPLTDSTPKPMLCVGGKPLIEYHVEALAKRGVRDIVINLAWLGEQIRAGLGNGEKWGVRIQYSWEQAGALETGGGIFQALPLLGNEPFLVLSGDIWSDYPLQRLPELAPDDVAHFVLVPNPDFHERGDFGLHMNRVVEGAQDRYTYANIGVFKSQFFEGCRAGRFPLAPLMFEWIRRERVSGELYSGRWRNVGTPVQLQDLDRELTILPH